MSLTLYDEFAGCGGSSQGAAAVPGVELLLAANHDPVAMTPGGICSSPRGGGSRSPARPRHASMCGH